MIREWYTEGYRLRLEGTGNGGAAIVCTSGGTTEYGRIAFDPDKNRHTIEWNRDGCLAIEQYKRDFWDNKFYTAMAKYKRSQS